MATLTLRQTGPAALEADGGEGAWRVKIAFGGPAGEAPEEALKPTELLALSLAGCKAMAALQYAARKGLNLSGVEVDVTYELADNPRRIARIRVHFRGLRAQLDPGALERVTAAINSCAIAATLHTAPDMDTIVD